MRELTKKFFDESRDLVNFINDNNIPQVDIQAICYRNRDGVTIRPGFWLFYWVDSSR